MKKGLLMGLFVVAIVHTVFSALFALESVRLGMKDTAYFWYASALASLLVANILGHHDVVRAELKSKS